MGKYLLRQMAVVSGGTAIGCGLPHSEASACRDLSSHLQACAFTSIQMVEVPSGMRMQLAECNE